MLQPWLLPLILCILSHCFPLSFSQTHPQNIEIFFPFVVPPPPPALPNFPTTSEQAAPIVPLTSSSPHSQHSHQASQNQLVKAFVATMIIAIVISGIILIFLGKFSSSRQPRVKRRTGPVPSKPILRKPEQGGAQMVNLKPLHWGDQVKNADQSSRGLNNAHSKGSNGYSDDITEALFGYVATDRKSPGKMKMSSNISNSPPPRIVILDPHKSQITGTVIRSLCITRDEILDAFIHGKRTLSIDTLEKLSNIAPNEEEATLLLDFNGNPTRLADAEFFLYHLFKSVPLPFLRLKAMLLRSGYEENILQLKESLKTVELGCNEIQMHKILWKLLKALSDAGIKAFRQQRPMIRSDQTSLFKLAVENVALSEVKNSIANKSLDVGIPLKGRSLLNEEKDNVHYMIKNAALINYGAFTETWFDLRARVDEIWKLLEHINGGDEGNGFVKDMEMFLNEAEDELEMVRIEETRVLELVKRIMDSCIQTGGFGDQQNHSQVAQVFVLVNDFLALVDQVCVEIAKDLKEPHV